METNAERTERLQKKEQELRELREKMARDGKNALDKLRERINNAPKPSSV